MIINKINEKHIGNLFYYDYLLYKDIFNNKIVPIMIQSLWYEIILHSRKFLI